MRQHPDPDHDEHKDLDRYHDGDDEDLEELGTPLYQGSGLSVRALTAEELQRFLDAHHNQPPELLGSGWAAGAATATTASSRISTAPAATGPATASTVPVATRNATAVSW